MLDLQATKAALDLMGGAISGMDKYSIGRSKSTARANCHPAMPTPSDVVSPAAMNPAWGLKETLLQLDEDGKHKLGLEIEQIMRNTCDSMIQETKQQLQAAVAAVMATSRQGKTQPHASVLEASESEPLAALQQSQQSLQSLQHDLQRREDEIIHLRQNFDASRRECDSRQAALHDKEMLLNVLRRDLEARNQEILQLKESLDASCLEKVHLKLNGRELMTFKGLTTSEANIHTLQVALKELNTECQHLAEFLTQHSADGCKVPNILDLPLAAERPSSSKELTVCGFRHLLLCKLAQTVFTDFYAAQLAVEVGSAVDFLPSNEYDETLLLKLRLEKKKAESWLKALKAAEVHDNTVLSVVDGYTAQFVSDMLIDYHFNLRDSKVLTGKALKDESRGLVSAAIRAQVIASAMHSQLIKIIVPGWLQNTMFHESAPDCWASWPGVVPLNQEYMQAGVRLAAKAGMIPAEYKVAAVFCQEPAVVQVAETVTELDKTRGEGVCCTPYKVLIRARMDVAGCWSCS